LHASLKLRKESCKEKSFHFDQKEKRKGGDYLREGGRSRKREPSYVEKGHA